MSDHTPVTVEEILSLKPCGAWPEASIREAFGDLESVTFEEILTTTKIAYEADRRWLLINLAEKRGLIMDCAWSCFCDQCLGDDGYPDKRRIWAETLARVA